MKKNINNTTIAEAIDMLRIVFIKSGMSDQELNGFNAWAEDMVSNSPERIILQAFQKDAQDIIDQIMDEREKIRMQ